MTDQPANDELAALLETRYDRNRENEALAILRGSPELARSVWTGGASTETDFIVGSTALHYAANDGKLALMGALLDLGADPNASEAHWYRSVLAWAANNARLAAMTMLLERGASPQSLDVLHAAAWGGSSAGNHGERNYVAAIELLVDAGADVNDRRHPNGQTPLDLAIKSGHRDAEHCLGRLGGEATA